MILTVSPDDIVCTTLDVVYLGEPSMPTSKPIKFRARASPKEAPIAAAPPILAEKEALTIIALIAP